MLKLSKLIMAAVMVCFAIMAINSNSIFADDACSSAPVAQTGQTILYATGDDGDLRMGVEWPTPRFTDNGDGTVTDNLTGLIWLKDANCFGRRARWDAIIQIGELNKGTDFSCSDSEYVAGTFNDWRLPNRKELESLLDLGQLEPSLPLLHPFDKVQENYYWSSVKSSENPDLAWCVDMEYGFVRAKDTGNELGVWPVRGISRPRFTDNGNGTVTDNLTGLIWLKDASCMGRRTWADALTQIGELNKGTDFSCSESEYVAGTFNDWRLPNRKELESLVDTSQLEPSLPLLHPFDGVESAYYWSSTTSEEEPDRAWYVDMEYGFAGYIEKINNRPVWPVRGISRPCAGGPEINTDLSLWSLRIKTFKRWDWTTISMLGTIDLPDLNLENGDTVESRVTIELFGVLPDGGDLVISNDPTLKVKDRKKLLIIRK